MPRDKKTEAIDLTELDVALTDLTDQQFQFWQAMDTGKYTQEEAYAIAFPDSKEWTKPSRQVAASRLWNNNKFMLCRQALVSSITKRAARSLDERVARMEELRQLCIATGNLGAAFQCEQAVGKLEGHYIDKKEITNRNTREELEILVDLARDGSQESLAFARKQAKDLGIEKDFMEAIGSIH